MKKFCVQSLIIGVGMGMIMTASFNFLMDTRNTAPVVALEGLPVGEDSGIEKTIGDLKKNLESEKDGQKEKKAQKDNEKDGMQEREMVENNKGNIQTKPEMVRLVISSGMNTYAIASLLWQEGLITDTEEFVDAAIEKGYTKIFKVGKREIPKNSTVEEILEILITKPQ